MNKDLRGFFNEPERVILFITSFKGIALTPKERIAVSSIPRQAAHNFGTLLLLPANSSAWTLREKKTKTIADDQWRKWVSKLTTVASMFSISMRRSKAASAFVLMLGLLALTHFSTTLLIQLLCTLAALEHNEKNSFAAYFKASLSTSTIRASRAFSCTTALTSVIPFLRKVAMPALTPKERAPAVTILRKYWVLFVFSLTKLALELSKCLHTHLPDTVHKSFLER